MKSQNPLEKSAVKDWSRFASFADLGVEIFHARFFSHRFGTHTHDTWGFGSVLEGTQDLAANERRSLQVNPGEISVIPPGEAHAGRVIGDLACEYVMVYLPDSLLQVHAHNLGLGRFDVSMQAMADVALARSIGLFVSNVFRSQADDLSAQEELLTGLISKLLLRVSGQGTRSSSGLESAGLVRALSYLDDHWADSVPLTTLSREASMSPAHFCRQFSLQYGMPPHRYQVVLRVLRAKELLARGSSIAETALATGFADHSHLCRHLKSCLGVTPSEIRNRVFRARTF